MIVPFDNSDVTYYSIYNMERSIKVTADLAEVYPDMCESFSNKHLLLLGQLRETFAAIYDGIGGLR